jgi:hypothetical protein
MTLAGGEAVLRGAGLVTESHRNRGNFYGLRGMKVRFEELDRASRTALDAVAAGPRRAPSSPAPPGRSPIEMVECLIYDDPGTEPVDPIIGEPATGRQMAESGALPPIGHEDDVTAVAPPPRRGGAPDTLRDEKAAANAQAAIPTVVGPAPNGPRKRKAGFTVPRPRTDPAIAIGGDGKRSTGPQDRISGSHEPIGASQEVITDTERNQELEPVEAIPAPPRLPVANLDDGRAARRGKPASSNPPPAAAPPDPKNAALPTMRLAPHEPPRPGSDYPSNFTPPPGLPHMPVDPLGITASTPLPISGITPLPVRQPSSPRRPMMPPATITPTEIVSPMALEARTERRRRGPMASERTDVVRVSYVRTAAVSATLGALLGLAAGYLLWGLDHESSPAPVTHDATPAAVTPVAPQPAVVTPDAGAAPAAAEAEVDAAPPAPPAAKPARPKPAPRRRR